MSPLVTWAIILTVVSLAGGGAAFGGLGGMLGLGGWNGKQPFACDGNDRVHAKKVTATFSAGSAVTVEGNCHFECDDCTIKAPVGAAVRGNGQAVFINGAVDGAEAIADVSGNGRFEVRGQTQLTGGKPRKSSNGQLNGLPPALLAKDPVKAVNPSPAERRK